MATKKKLLQAAAGTAAAGGAGAVYVDDVFAAYGYEGNSNNKFIKHGLNIADGATDNVVLHLTGDNLTDSSPYGATVTTSGNTAVETATKKFGTGSIYFDGNGDRLEVNNLGLILGEDDFTIEFWINIPNASPTKGIFHIWNGSVVDDYNIGLYYANNNLTFQMRSLGRTTTRGNVSTNTPITNNTWHHVALVRHHGYSIMFVDGTEVGARKDVGRMDCGYSRLQFGTHWDSAYDGNFYLDDLRITRGVARYTENFTAPTAAHPIDTASTGDGGLVWIKSRDGSNRNHQLADTERGATKTLIINDALPEYTSSDYLSSFSENGFTLGSNNHFNENGNHHVAWCFKKQERFFDVVKYTGNGTSQAINHSLNCTVGMMIVKRIGSNTRWPVYHRGVDANNPADYVMYANLTDEATGSGASGYWNNTEPTTTQFTVGNSSDVNANGVEYIAYLFAHNDGDGNFGENEDEDIIVCGQYNGTGAELNVDLGFEPQYLMVKRYDTTNDFRDYWSWIVQDTTRGFSGEVSTTSSNYKNLLHWNHYAAEGARGIGTADSANNAAMQWFIKQNGTQGFAVPGTYVEFNRDTNAKYIYMAIKKPNKPGSEQTVDDLFGIKNFTETEPTTERMRGPFGRHDMHLHKPRYISGSFAPFLGTRLMSRTETFVTSSGGSPGDYTTAIGDGYYEYDDSGYGYIALGGYGNNSSNTDDSVFYGWKRAKGFFDVVIYDGENNTNQGVNHQLGVAPEMMIIKGKTNVDNWGVYHKDVGYTKRMQLNSDVAAGTVGYWAQTPTSTDFFVTNDAATGQSGHTYMALLFASLDGVSKVGSFSHTNGTTQNIDCGFSNGSRWVMLKRYDGTGSWVILDAERGIVSGNDPYYFLNNSSNVVTTNDLIDPYSAGFTIDSSFLATGDFIFYAVANP